MKDVSHGRINTANLTESEWNVLNRVFEHKATTNRNWYTPTKKEWAEVRGILALVNIRRGYEIDSEGDGIQFGIAQISLNTHGMKALMAKEIGKTYTAGERLTAEEIESILIEDGLNPKELFPIGIYYEDDTEA